MKILTNLIVPIITMVLLVGCTVEKTTTDKISDIEYKIVTIDELPKELVALIEENKSTKMTLSYTDQGLEYIIVGYGAQTRSGYSVEILEVYEGENTVVIDTNLLGPSPDEDSVECATFPYVVILIDEISKPVMFE